MFRSYSLATALICGVAAFAAVPASAQKKYDVGATDTEIKLGNIVPYSGPASAFGSVGKVQAGFFRMINEQGGINGRKINYISYDDAYSPAKAVEQARKLVESDEVLAMFAVLGTASNSAIQKYLNAKKVPQLFVVSGATRWNDPKAFPWTIGYLPSYQAEARIYANYILKERPSGKIAVLYQNDDLGKDYLKGLRDALGDKASMIVIEEPYEVLQPTVDSSIAKMKSLGADIFINFSTPKFAAQAIKKVAELNWKPLQFVSNVSISMANVIHPAGLENAQGVISAAYVKDPTEPRWDSDPGMMAYHQFLAKYLPEMSRADSSAMTGYNIALTMVEVLRRCGDDLTRDNLVKQAAGMKNFEQGSLLPGIMVNTSPTDYAPIEQLQLMRFEGEHWDLFGEVLSGEFQR
ncbi:ABC transporter substrate-binding protein [Bradyrhizobium sp. KBS0727]|uniref:ABC transporter substrate-binding protein n=1 Tax=unclassified Bradyrhizobium TaxID=2631580 RepID=UPI00110E85F8|nr:MULTISPECIES: ABC transporter substrate-binding protein [unclassified Bradyrhizobium]QDW40592.1 ABC transporter substrate-binding protein [Bradyrhizobium sp. KBS0725]QDW47197.1 ABC transporter substrate-binding protein [Bradyrhizobium sp. KBS0727]